MHADLPRYILGSSATCPWSTVSYTFSAITECKQQHQASQGTVLSCIRGHAEANLRTTSSTPTPFSQSLMPNKPCPFPVCSAAKRPGFLTERNTDSMCVPYLCWSTLSLSSSSSVSIIHVIICVIIRVHAMLLADIQKQV